MYIYKRLRKFSTTYWHTSNTVYQYFTLILVVIVTHFLVILLQVKTTNGLLRIVRKCSDWWLCECFHNKHG